MKVLVIGGSSFIGRNFIEKAPASWHIKASFSSSGDFPAAMAGRTNVETFHCDMTAGDIPALGAFDIVLYLPTMTPGQATGDAAKDAATMAALHAGGVNRLWEKIERCGRFIYFSSGIFYLGGNDSDYRQSKVMGEANTQACAMQGGFDYVILRNMEVFGPYLARHKVYRRMAEACIRGDDAFPVGGDGTNLLDTMYIDDYIAILLKIIEKQLSNVILPFSRAEPITLKELARRMAGVFGNPRFALECRGRPTEDTRFVLDNTALCRAAGLRPGISLEAGLLKWKERNLA